jgi:ABC-type proline/glycine betaine transport system substrate-binding protein
MEATAGQIGEMANNVDNLGMTHADAATAFISNNRGAVDEWLK